MNDSDDEFYEMKPTKHIKKQNKKFNEDDFDYKVAASIVNIHKKEENNFSKWVETNYFHLKNLYKLSGVSIPIEHFFTYVYDHSQK